MFAVAILDQGMLSITESGFSTSYPNSTWNTKSSAQTALSPALEVV